MSDQTPSGSVDVASAIDLIVHDHAIGSVFQPIVDLVTGATVAFEALARGPDDSPLHEPTSMFSAARAVHRLGELDWACRLAALDGAMRRGLRPPVTIFVNVEPEVLDDNPPSDNDHVLARAMGGLRVIVELTERALLARPAALLAYVEEIRRRGWGIAVDDVGKDPLSVAMLSVIEPDVVKLDRAMVRQMQPSDATSLVSGINTYCRRSGGCILAEGLETQQDVTDARAAGAVLGQGWALGHPTSTPTSPADDVRPIPLISPRPHLPTRRLISMATRRTPATSGPGREIDRLTDYISEYATHLGDDTLVVIAAQDPNQLSASLRTTLESLAHQVAYVAVIGVGMTECAIEGAHMVDITTADPLASEWVVVATGLHDSVALVASHIGDDAPHDERQFDFTVSYDPRLVTDIARALLSRI